MRIQEPGVRSLNNYEIVFLLSSQININECPSGNIIWTHKSFQSGNRQFWASSRKSRDCAETYAMYVAQEIPQIDTEIAQKGHFRMETNECLDILIKNSNLSALEEQINSGPKTDKYKRNK